MHIRKYIEPFTYTLKETFDNFTRTLQQQKIAWKYSLEKLISLNFVNLSKIFCPRL